MFCCAYLPLIERISKPKLSISISIPALPLLNPAILIVLLIKSLYALVIGGGNKKYGSGYLGQIGSIGFGVTIPFAAFCFHVLRLFKWFSFLELYKFCQAAILACCWASAESTLNW